MKSRNIERNLGEIITKPLNSRKPIKTAEVKYIDDKTQSISVDLKKEAMIDPNPNTPQPVNYHDRTGDVMPNDENKLQEEIDNLVKYAEEHLMKINETKTKVMIFNNSRKVDVTPNLTINGETVVNVIDETKLLGVMLRSDMKCKLPSSKML